MKRYYRTRTTYAPANRVQPVRSGATIYATTPGEGILRQTCSGQQYGFTSPIATRQRADNTTVYFVESDTFTDRYFAIYRQNGAWVLVGESDNSIDRARKRLCVAKVEACLGAEQMCEVA
jgi:hypothetical protein